ncbi:putative ubiquitinyl hydrolase 1 [Helianthus annuus]|nr:putative ubiquitinyl hydrolase 1 [Helianthus annuus]
MGDSAAPHTESNASISSCTKTLDPTGPEDFSLTELKKELDMDSLMSTELIEDCDECSSAAEPNAPSEPLNSVNSSCSRSQFEAQKPVPSVAVASSWNDDGYENPSTVGAGLANLVNTCFFNAVLQCFTHSVLLVQGLYSHAHPTPCDSSNERFCLICALREHIELSLSSSRKIVSPWKLVDNLRYFSSSFQRYQQEDAHEFLQCFLDKLESSLSNSKTKEDSSSSQSNNLVKQVFGGRVISKLRCCNCNHISDTYEPFADLSLEIKDVNTLSTALESFTKVEHIEDEEMKFTCDECKQKVSVEKQLLLDQIPLTCAFHLKRFKNDGSHVEKIDKHVDFPLELDLQPYTRGSQSNNMDLKYELYAVVVHTAFTSSCGHYYSYIRSAPNTWYKFDDSKVTSVSEELVLSSEAYILFYAKQGTFWFSNFMETYKPTFLSNIPTTSPKSVLENVDAPNVHSDGIKAPADHHPRHPQSDDVAVAPLKPITNVVKVTSPLILKEYGSNHRVEAQKNTCVTPTNSLKHNVDIDGLFPPLTPPRSPGLDTSDDENLEVVFAAKLKQSKPVEKVTSKRPRNNEAEDSAKREAMRMCKRMPGARGDLLMAALSAKSENSLVRKSKKMVSSPRKNISKSHERFNSVKRNLGRFSLT